jgi:hypothetical protein
MIQAIDQLSKQSRAQLNALAAGVARGSLLLTSKGCPDGWRDVNAKGELLVGALSQAVAGTHGQVSWPVTLRPGNIPRVVVSPSVGNTLSASLTIPSVSMNLRGVRIDRPLGIAKCDSDCDRYLPFANVPVQLTGVTAVAGHDNPDAIKLEARSFNVTVCMLE